MRALLCREFGPLDRLEVGDIEAPEPAADQVVVAVDAAGVNFVDTVILKGGYQFSPRLPFVPGSEVAGTILEVGADVVGWAPGDAIVASPGAGGFAERVAVPARLLLHRPASVAAAVAATVLQSYSTALFALTRRDTVRAGETVLVLGAGGGVGLAAVDVATSLGAQVIAVASTPEKRGMATAAGAVATIDPGVEDLKARARELSGGGVDVVVDPVGGALSESALRALAFTGRYHVIGFAAGSIARIPLNLVLLNSRTVFGIEWGGWVIHHPTAAQEIGAELFEGILTGRLHPVAPHLRSLADAPQALADVAERRVAGKVALLP
jgi:NADPH2:quinone reductase